MACLRRTWRGSNGGCTDAATPSENTAAATVRRKLGQHSIGRREARAAWRVLQLALRVDGGAVSPRNRKKASLGLNGSPSRIRPNTSPSKFRPIIRLDENIKLQKKLPLFFNQKLHYSLNSAKSLVTKFSTKRGTSPQVI